MSDEDTFISRWSRRKQAAGTAALEPPPEPAAAAPPDQRTDAEILEELGLPDPSALKPGDDIRGFMQEAVPARLRRLALRQLWRSNPVLANLDGLLEYGEDYTDAATVVESLQTAYRVGRGFWTEEDERRAQEAAPQTAAEADQVGDASDPEATTPDDPDDATPAPTETTDAPGGTVDDGPEPALAHRRMAFRYES